MKTVGRILIILTASVIVMGITYAALSASSSSTSANSPAIERGGEDLRTFIGERPEFGGEGPRGGGWMFGLIKNVGIVAFIVALVVIPKNLLRRKTIPVRVK
jgi:hypothetical protein